jgi:hypothetical protein
MDGVALRTDSKRTTICERELRMVATGARIRVRYRETRFEEQSTAERDLGIGHRIVGGNERWRETRRQMPLVLRVVAGGIAPCDPDPATQEDR